MRSTARALCEAISSQLTPSRAYTQNNPAITYEQAGYAQVTAICSVRVVRLSHMNHAHFLGEAPLEPAKKRREDGQVSPHDRRHQRGAEPVLLDEARRSQHRARHLPLRLQLRADLGDAPRLDRVQEPVGLLGLHLADGSAQR